MGWQVFPRPRVSQERALRPKRKAHSGSLPAAWFAGQENPAGRYETSTGRGLETAMRADTVLHDHTSTYAAKGKRGRDADGTSLIQDGQER